MTRKWLITILVALALILLAVWLYTGWASEEVESEVTEPLGVVPRAGEVLALVPGLPTG